ncbi:MAG: hypothetical protein M0040_07285 [Actinomycetota bacterium]|jgi:hypothetical protein|nr:hypothetical protein [Actinomycetota bacterium]
MPAERHGRNGDVRAEVGDRRLGPELEAGSLDPSTALAEAAAVHAALLRGASGDVR